MVFKDFSETVKLVTKSQDYTTFKNDHPSYELVHGFLQLNSDFTVKANWQLGYYSKDKDDLGTFDTNPVKFSGFEEAFKKGGTIDSLGDYTKFLQTSKIIEKLDTHMKSTYSNEVANTYLIILQVIGGISVYNITIVTASFSMITIRFDALSGKIISDEKRSVLDLRKN